MTMPFIFSEAVSQSYEIDVFKEKVVIGNDAFVKCDIPSFVQDFVKVGGWVDSEGTNIRMGNYNDSTCCCY